MFEPGNLTGLTLVPTDVNEGADKRCTRGILILELEIYSKFTFVVFEAKIEIRARDVGRREELIYEE